MKSVRKQRKPKKILWFCIIVSFIILFGLWYSHKNSTTGQMMDAIQVIQNKTSKQAVPSRFSPVLIFRMDFNHSFQFSGSGSLFKGNHGNQILTSEHLFPQGIGEQRYASQPLRSNQNIVYGIEKILYTGKELTGDMADVALLKLGDAKPIFGFSMHTLVPATTQTTITPFVKSTYFITSLVTSEKVRVLGRTTDPSGTRVNYLLIDYASISGESGTGFVDNDDNIFVLKASPIGFSHKDYLFLGEFTSISIVYGPLKIRQ